MPKLRGCRAADELSGNCAGGQDYLYNGKEFEEDLDLNWYDYGARYYDPALGRWNAVDPLAEKYAGWSPYCYTLNNPVLLIDPDGRAADWIFDQQADGSYKKREGEANDGGENFHTINHNNGTTTYFNVQTKTSVTVNHEEREQKIEDYKATTKTVSVS